MNAAPHGGQTEGVWRCARCGKSPETHAASDCLYEPTLMDGLAQAIIDLCWKATPYGGGEDVGAYLLPAGTVHRLIGAAQGAGIPAALRAVAAPGVELHIPRIVR